MSTERARADLGRFFAIENEVVFDAYLAVIGLDEDAILRALSAETVADAAALDSDWARLLAHCLSGAFLAGADARIFGAAGLCAPLYPFLNWAAARIDDWRGRFGHDWDRLGPVLLRQLSDQLFAIGYKAFVLEANIAAQAATAAGRPGAGAFAGRIADSAWELRRFHLRYAALARLIATTCLHWRRNSEALLERFDRDRDEIAARLLGGARPGLSDIVVSLSDPHDGGQRVAILTFEDGARLVYKPRAIEIDVAYYALLDRLNAAGFAPPLRRLTLIARDGYGWIEFVEARAMAGPEEVDDFYRRMGAQLAILHLTRGTDFHAENIIASGAQPMLVDLETLIHARSPPRISFTPSLAWKRLHDSVFACGLLPGWHDGDPEAPSPELSGIAAPDEQTYKDHVDMVREEAGVPRIVRERISVPAGLNRPASVGATVDPGAHVEAIVEGFERGFAALARAAGDLAEPGDLLREALRAEVRHVALATAVYVGLARRSTHPDFLTRTTHRELIFAILATRVRDQPSAGRLVRSEMAALLQGDVPKFTTRADSVVLRDESGAAIPGYLAEDAAAEVLRRLGDLTPARCAEQVRILRMAMATIAPPMVVSRPRGDGAADLAAGELPAEAIEGEVRALAEAVLAEATMEADGIDWIGLSEVDYGRCRVCALGAEFYDGAAGIGVFLAHAGRRLGEARFADAARLCGESALRLLEHKDWMAGGGFVGRGGAAFGLLHMAAMLNRPDWTARAADALLGLAEDAAKDRIYDIVGGSAGLCGVLLAAHEVTGEDALLAAAVRRAEHLVERRVDCGTGWGWPPRRSQAPLTGFSHGAAGLGWALLRVGDRAGREDLLAAGRAAFAYEHALYSPAMGGWPDLRDIATNADGSRYSIAWCHGAPGIGLARVTLPARLLGEADRLDGERAMQGVIAGTFGGSDCLCHGELGNLEALLPFARLTGRAELGALVRRRASAAVRRARREGWRCGITPDWNVPGLMTGLSGIGYGLMRLYWPEDTPSLLALEAPAPAQARA